MDEDCVRVGRKLIFPDLCMFLKFVRDIVEDFVLLKELLVFGRLIDGSFSRLAISSVNLLFRDEA